MQEDFDIEVEWLGYELHPETPRGGVSTVELLGPSRAAAAGPYMKRFAQSLGVEIGEPDHVSNTRRILAMTEYARDHGKLIAFRDLAMEAHWLDGRNLESDEDLLEIASKVGLNADDALAAADSKTYLQRVDAARAQAAANRISAIPTFLFGDRRVVGCQSYDAVKKVALQAGLKSK